MTALSADEFDDFFSSLWSEEGRPRTPFQWQRDLVRRVLAEGDRPWPEAIALPTAAGKTACLDIAVFALAAQADRIGTEIPVTAARRIFFVVDRRIIVDEAHERADRIAAKLHGAQDGILRVVSDNLRKIARGETSGFENETPLAVHALRGGMYRSEAWARDPLHPTIVASTVDQLGSRLLFRAYGRGPGMWPVYAGLASHDSVILLDEAHCAQPFMQTLQAVERYRSWATASLGRSFFPVVMSATPPTGLDVFEDTSDEPSDPEHPLGRRQLAHKRASMEVIASAKGTRAYSILAEALARAAEDMADETLRAIVIFVNRVATARAVRTLLGKKHGENAVLLTGRMRPIDKDDTVLQQLKPLRAAESQDRHLSEPRFVVATQTLEVGADLDFDGLVTECASLDALRQRFGRLNRMGRPIEARAAILVQGDQARNSDDDPVYGSALANTWTWLNDQKDDHGEIDFGIAHLARCLPEGEALARLNAPSPDAPVMLPAHVDRWAQTAPVPAPTPDVALFLRGPREGAADVQVCWRADIEVQTREERASAIEAIALCPPSSSECLPVPIGVFRRWMAGLAIEDQSGDVEGVGPDAGGDFDEGQHAVCPIVRWHGRDTVPEDVVDDPRSIRPGDVVVVPISAQGWQALGDLPPRVGEDPARLDVGDRAHLTARARAILRLHPRLVGAWPACRGKDLALALLAKPLDELAAEPDEFIASLREVLSLLAEPETPYAPQWTWLGESAQALHREGRRRSFKRALRVIGGQSLVITGQTVLPDRRAQADTFSDEDDTSASGIARPSGAPVRLSDHLPGVAAFARRFANGCGLPPALADAIERAGLLHDLGKADPRFQALLRGGNSWAVDDMLAKSGEMYRTPAAFRAARAASRYPHNGRHELLSVRLAESVPVLLPEDDELRELVLHLVASHHGYCRPFAPVVFDEGAPAVAFEFDGHKFQWQGPTKLERLDGRVAERFWRLIRHYGWWGLAWLEALLRLADHRRSEYEASHDDGETL